MKKSSIFENKVSSTVEVQEEVTTFYSKKIELDQYEEKETMVATFGLTNTQNQDELNVFKKVMSRKDKLKSLFK